MNRHLVLGFLGVLLMSGGSYAEDTYKLMRKEVSHDESTRVSVMLKDITQFACAMKVVETSSYHRGLIDGAKEAGKECTESSYEADKLSITVRVASCENAEEWLTTQYYCEKVMGDADKESKE